MDQVVLTPDKEDSAINDGLSIAGYDITKNNISQDIIKYKNNQGNPEANTSITTTEVLTTMEIQRDGWGLYLKCFIALFATTIWILISLFICSYHRVNPISMIPGVLLGAVSNVLVGANLLPA